jgi:tetraacyldisaccharide 4'-kinase
LPAGPLRESAANLKTVDAVIWHHRSSRTDKTAQPHPSSGNPNEFDVTSHISASYDLFDVNTRQPLAFFADKAVVGMAGIALPEVFFAMLAAQNIHGDMLALPDHYDFDDAFVHELLQKPANYYLMTEKDAVKLRHLIAPAQRVGKTFWVVPLELVEQNSLAQLTQFVLNKIQTIHATKIDFKQE